MKPHMIITGAQGYLASLIQLYNKDNFDFTGFERHDVDYSKPQEVGRFFDALDFDLFFHTAANAQTAACENDPEGTHLVNCDSAIEIAKVCRKKGKRFVFISTEQVFNGKTVPGPFDETAAADSVTNYGRQKAEVDSWIRENLDDYIIIRLSWQFGMPLPHIKPSPGIVLNTLAALRSQTSTKFTVNERRCMTYSQHLADNFKRITELPTGEYHIASPNDKSTYECAKIVAHAFGYPDAQIEKFILPDNERYSDRFRDYRLDNAKALGAGIELGSSFEDDVERCARDFGWA